MSFANFNIVGKAKSELITFDNKAYSMLLIESTFYNGSERASNTIPCVIYNNKVKGKCRDSIKGKTIAVNGYIGAYQNPNSLNDYPSISLVVSELEIFDSINSDIQSHESESPHSNDSDSDNYSFDDDNLPF